MSTIRRNLVANFVGRGLSATLAIAFPPVFLGLLGAESYGLVGFFGTLTAVLGLLDLGLAMTLNREIARLSAIESPEAKQEMHDLVRTHAVIFGVVGAASGLGVYLLAPVISHHWVNVRALPVETVTRAVQVMGLVFALQWPGGVYNGVLVGLQQQVTSNVLSVAGHTVRLAGGALFVWGVSRTVEGFLLWQAVTAAVQTVVCARIASRALPRGLRGSFQRELVRRHWQFSAGISGISVLAVMLTQVDKLVVGKLFTLEELGYYTLAGNVGAGLYFLIGPVFTSVFPRLCQLVSAKDDAGLVRLYHASCQLMSTLVLPAALSLAFFAPELILGWTGDAVTVARTWHVVIPISLGTAMNGLMNLPYGLQLAHGRTRLTLVSNAVAVLVLVPLVATLGSLYGVTGAALGWTILNAGYLLISVPIMHRELLKGELRRWYFDDIGRPLLGALLVLAPMRLLLQVPPDRVASLLVVALAGALAMLSTVLASPAVRGLVFERLARLRGRSARAA